MARARRPWSFAGFALLLAGLAVSGWIYWKAQDARAQSDPEQARREGRPIPVRTAQVQSRHIDDVIGATAVTAPSRMAAIRVAASRRALTAQPEGLKIKAVHVASGDAVTKGQLLMELEDHLFRVSLERAEADLTAAQAEFAAQQAALGNRWISKDSKKAEDLPALAELARAQSKLTQAQTELEFGRADLERTQIKSPLDGFMNTVSIVPGVEVQGGHSLTEVLQLDPLHVTVEIPEERIDDVQAGQEAEIILDNAPRQTLHGKVRHILPQGNAHERIVPVIIEVPNPGGRIKAGITGWVNLHGQKTVISAPSAAIIKDGERAAVFVVQEAVALLRDIKVRDTGDLGETVVQAGLVPGEEVVIFNHLYLRDRDRVDTDWLRWARRD
jgi:membrane fusion protein, multidrug efflux system